MNNKKVLYISYDGMTDPLGQSQVIPYLQGLSDKGFIISILSFEKKTAFKKNKLIIKKTLSLANINWIPIPYHATPPLLSTIFDIAKMWQKAKNLQKQNNYSIVHCRSYISALIGLKLKKKFSIKFIFDMRGFWVDERVEGKIWNLKNPIFKIAYKFFKKKEIDFLNHADHTISLTNNAKKEINSWFKAHKKNKISVIPCCVDTNLFQPKPLNASIIKKQLGINKTTFVLTYLGSIGTWYMLEEMLAFFKVLQKTHIDAKFLFITNDSSSLIKNKAAQVGLSDNDIICKSVSRKNVPRYLEISNFSIFFIKPTYSKKASSPTKMGEILSMKVPIICNAGVGDVVEIMHKNNIGIIVDGFSDKDYEKAIIKIKTMKFIHLKKIATNNFSLTKGINAYEKIYKSI